ncbi:MAG TPA: NADH-quinone oxidoreductase subunit NuoE [Ktedonobacterales bacterium]|nr:NADH-quinone oxidoreductase subunit NuoE [Ktedonobacterales bacterium]
MITDEVKDRMRAACARFPERRSGMLPCLHLAQEAEGYVTPEGIQAVAEVIGCKVDEVESIVTFYAMYFTKPVGKHVIKVCTSISCYLRGCDDLMAHLEQRLGIKRGETTPDGQFTLLPIECLAACGMAPVLQVNSEFVENVTMEHADALIERLKRGESVEGHPGEWEAAEHTAAVREAATATGTDRKKAE